MYLPRLWPRAARLSFVRRVRADLGALQPHAGHQTLLIENECVDVVLQRRRRHRPRHALIHDHNAGADAELLTIGVIDRLHGLVGHQEQGVAKGLNAGLEPIGHRSHLVVTGGTPLHE